MDCHTTYTFFILQPYNVLSKHAWVIVSARMFLIWFQWTTSLKLWKMLLILQKLQKPCKSIHRIHHHSTTSFSTNVVSLFFFYHNAQSEPGEHAKIQRQLEDLLKAWRMKRHYIEGDGNCNFSAVAFSLLTHSPFISQHSPQFFSNLGIDPSNDLKSVSMKLRNLTVAEWKCNQQDYKGFLPDVDIQEEAIKFMQSGYFFGKLADTIVLALSNLLGLPFIVFTSSIYQPVITITPRHLKIPIPVYLAFNQSGAGHYNDVVLCDDDQIQPLVLPLTSNGADAGKGPCSCGNKTDTSHCHPVASKYTTITCCTCCKEGKPCTNLCRCKTCNNPFGKKFPTTDSMQTSRKRPRQPLQQ